MDTKQQADTQAQESSTEKALRALEQENAEIKSHLRHLAVQQSGLAQRLHRVEESVVFRFLRWFGGRLLDAPPWVLRYLPLKRFLGQAAPLSYEAWIQESEMMESIERLEERAPHYSVSAPLVSVVVLTNGGSPGSHSGPAPGVLQAIAAQSYSTREVHTVETASETPRFQEILDRCRGEFIVMLPGDVVLEPGALDFWVGAAGPGVNLVYSDWDHLEASGARHSPRFTPAFSPRLLEQTLYWGDCFFMRAAAARRAVSAWASAPEDAQTTQDERPPLHRLALSVAKESGEIVRIPRVLWHALRTPVAPAPLAVPRKKTPDTQRTLTPRVSVVICSRSPKRIRKCLSALRPTLCLHSEVVVVAHETGDSSGVSSVVGEFGAKSITYRGVFHFGLMNELGAKAASGSILVFLNDDVFPIANDWLERMVERAADPEVGAVGALLFYPSGAIQHAGVAIGGLTGPIHVGQYMRDSRLWPWLKMTREVTAVTGACLAVRRQVWDELGGFDPRFPVNYNDVDFCLRAGKLGYRIVLETGATLTHEESQSRSKGVSPEEFALFASLWPDVLEAPDPYFHPELTVAGRNIQLRSPWHRLRP